MTVKHNEYSDQNNPERGSALVYILIAIALLAALTVSFMEPSGQQTQSQNTFKTVSELDSQIEMIRSSVQECVLLYPGGDITIDISDPGGSDPNASRLYPINPDSTHFATQAGDRNVENLRCPGNPGDDPDHQPIFGARSGKFLPPSPPLFGEWQWYNGTDGVFYWIETDKSDAYIQTALERLDAQYAQCEADVISGGTVFVSDDATLACPASSTCFRVFMVRKASAIPACP